MRTFRKGDFLKAISTSEEDSRSLRNVVHGMFWKGCWKCCESMHVSIEIIQRTIIDLTSLPSFTKTDPQPRAEIVPSPLDQHAYTEEAILAELPSPISEHHC